MFIREEVKKRFLGKDIEVLVYLCPECHQEVKVQKKFYGTVDLSKVRPEFACPFCLTSIKWEV